MSRNPCLFCTSPNPRSVEHIFPESLGNDDIVLTEDVCNSCNNYFSKIESYVLQKTELAFWRTLLGIRSKRGNLPSVDLSQPDRPKGSFPNRHPEHTDGVGFTAHADGSCSVGVSDDQVIGEIIAGERNHFHFVMTPKLLHQFGRFLCKIGVELICSLDPSRARAKPLEGARNYARYGSTGQLWPIFNFTNGSIRELRRMRLDGIEEVDCFDYSLLEVGQYTLFRLKVGTSNWVICLDDQWPTPEIRKGFPEAELQLIWYPSGTFR